RDNHAHARKAGRQAIARVAPHTHQSTSPLAAYGAITPFGSPTDRQNPQSTMSPARETAVHECSLMSRQYLETTWGDMQMHKYRTGMRQQGRGKSPADNRQWTMSRGSGSFRARPDGSACCS